MNRILFTLLALMPTAAFAQSAEEAGRQLDRAAERTTTTWYTSPWLIAGIVAVILVIALIAAISRRGGSDHTTIIKT